MSDDHPKSEGKKAKLVRDSFTIPKDEYAAIDALKARALKLGVGVKKSELLRAGLMLLQRLDDTRFRFAMVSVPTIKTGRPTSLRIESSVTPVVPPSKSGRVASAAPAAPKRISHKVPIKSVATAAPAPARSESRRVTITNTRGGRSSTTTTEVQPKAVSPKNPAPKPKGPAVK